MIHGTGGGFDQGLLFARRLVDAGYRVIAPSRFGYLRSDFPTIRRPRTRRMRLSTCSTIWASTGSRLPAGRPARCRRWPSPSAIPTAPPP
jgi:dienelactone hydrolase